MKNYGIIKVAMASPYIKVADTAYNTENIMKCIIEAEAADSGIIVLPELTITGSTCGDLFLHPQLYKASQKSLSQIIELTKSLEILVILGTYAKIRDRNVNIGLVIHKGQVLGAVPKRTSDSPYFSTNLSDCDGLRIEDEEVSFDQTIFKDREAGLAFEVSIGADLYSSKPNHGAHIVFNISAIPNSLGFYGRLKNIMVSDSISKTNSCIYTCAGTGESSTDRVYSAMHIVAEQGDLLTANNSYERKNIISYAEIDFGKSTYARSSKAVNEYLEDYYIDPLIIDLEGLRYAKTLSSTYNKNPFMPTYDREKCKEIMDMQVGALVKRISHIGSKKLVLGISGGLDSTAALLVAVEAMKSLGRDPSDVIAVTLPGFGTTDKTYENALTLMKTLGSATREISIKESVLQHFKDIGHDSNLKDLTYENSQARERTQILMDIAGSEGGIMVGTGDLSEIALGWCTYGGDHMSMYSVNGGIPKTVLPHLLTYYIEENHDNKILKEVLEGVINTPISPELLPPDEKGEIVQKTEDSVGPYALHDFFIYSTLKWGYPKDKLLFLAKHVFKDDFSEDEIAKWLNTFYKRFFSQQFKRNCMPDGPQIFDISLSPRGGFAMPSDVSSGIW